MRLSRAHFATTAPSGPEKRAASPHFSLSVREAQEGGGCAVVISKKVAKLSVSRHLLKRRAFSVIKEACSPTRILIVYARPGAASLDYPAIDKELSGLLARTLP
ncbi:MAG: ribonuclease P protein component [Patescibacteria group bacterium]